MNGPRTMLHAIADAAARYVGHPMVIAAAELCATPSDVARLVAARSPYRAERYERVETPAEVLGGAPSDCDGRAATVAAVLRAMGRPSSVTMLTMDGQRWHAVAGEGPHALYDPDSIADDFDDEWAGWTLEVGA